MSRKIIDIGVVGNDGTGDSIRDSFRKVNENFRELYGSLGLGENLTFLGLDDSPDSFDGTVDTTTGNTPLVTVNNEETGVQFKTLVAGTGVSLDFKTDPNAIIVNSSFAALSGDPAPQIGGDLSARSGGEQYRIVDLPPYDPTATPPGGPIYDNEVVSKSYADGKVSLAGIDSIDPATGNINVKFGQMTGPLILSRNPLPDDDQAYDGLIAATKSYVDNSAFGSSVNLYVATSGSDDRPSLDKSLQGRALAYAYRTIEAALKRAEEIINEARPEIGPYKKVLTYNEGTVRCTLDRIETAPSSGTGFSGNVLLNVDTITLENIGVNYNVGDILTFVGGTYVEPCRIQVLSTTASPGAIITFRVLSTGVYSALPGILSSDKRIVQTTVTTATGGFSFGTLCTLNVTFKVNKIIVNDQGSGYGLVSVRITGGGGSGAFGVADVSPISDYGPPIVGGRIRGISITDGGSGFTDVPVVVVNLPRFHIRTGGQRTDFTGNVLTDTVEAARTRDIREGLYLRGETSGALAQILSHSGELDSEGNEIFDVDIIYGNFLTHDNEGEGGGEVISYGDVTITTHITIKLESGIYEENYPLRMPQNVSIVGDEFRRCIIRPRSGISTSPWAFLYFRRDPEIDGLQVTDRLLGYHYLSNTANPVYPLVNNPGKYVAGAALLELNRSFFKEQVVNWIDYQIENNITPFSSTFVYNRTLCQRDVGLLVDSWIYDMRYGSTDRTISAALKYKSSDSALIAITTQLSETIAGIERLHTLAQMVVQNITITELYDNLSPQIVDGAFTVEENVIGSSVDIVNITNEENCIIATSTPHGLTNGDEIYLYGIRGLTELNGNNYYAQVLNGTQLAISEFSDLSVLVDTSELSTYTSGGTLRKPGGLLTDLKDVVIDVISNSSSVNYPKDNDQMDVFLANDAVRWQGITCQGHGGFMVVLDPWGQILAKSPYAQECASFARSTGRQTFAGGMFVDGFSGNIKFKILSKDSDTYIRVGGLSRKPELPASFIVEDTVYRINYIRDFSYNVEPGKPITQSTASFIMDETTPWPFDVIDYNQDICYRDVGLIVSGLGYDMVLGTNYNARKAGLSYRQANAAVVVNDQLDITVRAIQEAHEFAKDYVLLYTGAGSAVDTSKNIIATIVRNGSTFAPPVSYSLPPGVATSKASTRSQLISNIGYIQDEVISWIDYNISNGGIIWAGFTYDSTACQRDVGYIIDSIRYDAIFGSNYRTVSSALRYLMASAGTVLTSQKEQTLLGLHKAKILTLSEISDSTIASRTSALWNEVIDIIDNGAIAADAYTLTVPTSGTDNAFVTGYLYARQQLQANKTFIQDEIIEWIADQVSLGTGIWSGFTYDDVACRRDVGLIVDALIYDLNYGGNLQTYDAAKAYYDGAVAQYGTGEKDQILAAMIRLKAVVGYVIVEDVSWTPSTALTQDTSGTAGSSGAKTTAEALVQSIWNTINSDGTLPTRAGPDITWTSSVYQTEFANLGSASSTIQTATTDWIDGQIGKVTLFTGDFSYNSSKCRRDVGYFVEALIYDLLYGGNSATRDAARRYYDGVGDAEIYQGGAGEENETAEAYEYFKYVAQRVIENKSPTTEYGTTTRVVSSSIGSVDEIIAIESLMDDVVSVINGGFAALPTEVLPDLDAYVYQTSLKDAKVILDTNVVTIQENTIEWINDNINSYEVLMPGNRSALSNDFTQINDMGYGIFVTNGGLTECVSMFTYYCYTSYYSLNGGQIRSVSGSSAHGVYALVAEGADPLEIPTPVTLYYDLSQGAEVYFPDATYANEIGKLVLYVTNYTYVPQERGEIEIDFGYTIVNYAVGTVSTAGLPDGVVRLGLNDDTEEGLLAVLSDGTPVTIRQNSQVILTGDVVDVTTRPSTGLVLQESPDVYRIIEFTEYADPVGLRNVTVDVGSPAVVRRDAHELRPNYQIEFRVPVVGFEATIDNGSGSSGNVLTVSAITSGSLAVGMTIQGGSVSPTTISAQLTGDSGDIGTYIIDDAQLVGTTVMEGRGTVPEGISEETVYFVLPDDFTENYFQISDRKNGFPTNVTAPGVGQQQYQVYGLAKTNLRENYNFIELRLWGAQPFNITPLVCTVSTADPCVITTSSNHGFNPGDAIRFVTSGELPRGITRGQTYWVSNVIDPSSFTILSELGTSVDVSTAGIQSGIHQVGTIIGNPGDSELAIIAVTADEDRVLNSKFVFLGQEYTVTGYDNEAITGEAYALVRFSPPLANSVNQYNGFPTFKAGVPRGEVGTLTIRISLTRVTGHDLLEIGTGSYADTNYPNEIFGGPVQSFVQANEAVERGVGRTFFVTTDQFGNFNVGPFFRVDQGTGTVTFSAAIALSNLDGLGFKRGVTIAEFSSDPTMSGNASDSVPTENAVRTYIDYRLGLSHVGAPIDDLLLIPQFTGGFMALDGQLSMKADMSLGFNKAIDVSDPEELQDAVNLRSLKWDNFQDFYRDDITANELLVFTGNQQESTHASIVGDISLSVDSTLHTLDAQINPGVIVNNDINSNAGIAQSKLAMQKANTFVETDPVNGWSGSATKVQSDLGLAKFSNLNFETVEGYVRVKSNGIALGEIQQLSPDTVIGNSTGSAATPTAVTFATVVNEGLAVKKSNFTTTGFLRRKNGASFTGDTGVGISDSFEIVEMASIYTGASEYDTLVVRSGSGDFGGRIITADQFKVMSPGFDARLFATASGTSASVGYNLLYDYNGGVTISMGGGTGANTTFYDNTSHVFRLKSGTGGYAPITASSITVATLTTGGTTTAGTITGNWTLSTGSRMQATYADLAEYYEADDDYSVGTVMIFGGDKEVTTGNTKGDHRVAGVVSENAALIMNEGCPGIKTLLALQGRVPCKVVGKIQKGDLMVTSGIPGVAISVGGDAKAGTIIGKALEDYDSDHIGTIEVAVGRA